MNCDNMRGCCSPCSQLAQQLEETNTRAVQAYNLAAQAFAAVIPPVGGSNIDVTLVSGPAYEIALKNPMDEDVVINADLTVNGDIYQNGSAYESHAEQLYTTKDTVIMRDGATTGLAPGDVAGLIMKLYDGVNDGALVVSNDGTARVGDVGSEQPLMTRDEAADMTDGAILEWDALNNKAVTSDKAVSDLTPKGYIRAHFTGSQTITANTVSAVNLNLSSIMDNDVFSFSSSTHKITVKKAGNYLINGSLLAVFAAAGRAEVAISYNTENEQTYAIQYTQGLTGTESLFISCMMNLSVNDEIGLTAWHASGNITVSPNKMATNLTMVYLGN